MKDKINQIIELIKKNPKYKKYLCIGLVALVVLIIAICIIIGSIKNGKEAEEPGVVIEEVEEPEEIFEETVSENEIEETVSDGDAEEIIYCDRHEDLDEYASKYEDVYAWIVVPNTKVDYPVLQSETDNYWLERNLDGSTGYPGCLYTNKLDAKDFSSFNTVIYGHNMKNKTMFGSLHSFDDQEFFDENEVFYIYTLDKRFTYEIYATVRFSNYLIPAFYNFDSEEGKQGYIDMTINGWQGGSSVDHYREGIEVTTEDKLVTLATCIGNSDYRFLVMGKMIEEAEYYPLDENSVSDNEAEVTEE